MSTKRGTKQSVKKELILFTALTIMGIVLILSFISVRLIQSSTNQALTKSMEETSKLVADKIDTEIESYSSISDQIDLYIKAVKPTSEELKSYLISLAAHSDLNSVDLLNQSGISAINGVDRSDLEAFQNAEREPYLSDPIINNEEVSFDYAEKKDCGIIVFSIPYKKLGDIINDVKMGKTGSSYVLNSQGDKIVHSDFSLVLQKQNNLEEVKKDPKTYKEVAALETKMTKGESGFGFYTWKGEKKFGFYKAIPNSNGWSVNVTALSSEFMAGSRQAIFLIVILGIIALVVAMIIMVKMIGGILGPVKNTLEAVEKMSTGDLDVDIPVKKQNELGIMAENINKMAGGFRNIIKDISYMVTEISSGNFCVESQENYMGEFGTIQSGLQKIVDDLNEIMLEIRGASQQVLDGSAQIAGSSQGLSQGAAEQAGAVERLSVTVQDISEHIHKTTADAQLASEQASDAAIQISEYNQKMQEMSKSIKEISSSSNEISKIIKTIEDIAFQTNILALNAAVEAARAGAAGKGFAVVAGEVRNLAAKSAEAAKNTTTLIEGSIKAVEDGVGIAKETENALTSVVESIISINDTVNDIASAAEIQADSIVKINEGMGQISNVIQNNSAASQESAATCEELSGQAQILENLVQRFELKTNQVSTHIDE